MGLDIVIKGSGFVPGTTVYLTICEQDIHFLPVSEIVANSCGAFRLECFVPGGCPVGVVSVKAWTGAFPPDPAAVLEATWPLDIIWP